MIFRIKKIAVIIPSLFLVVVAPSSATDFLYNGFIIDAYYSLGEACYNDKNLDCAIENYSKAIDRQPGDSRIYNSRGLAYHFKKEYKKSVRDFDRAIQLNPNNYRAYNNRGNAKRRLGQYELALADITKSISINPRNIKAYHNRASVYIKTKRYHEAESDLNIALDLGSRHHSTYSNIGYVAYKLKKYDQALVDLNKGVQLLPTDAQTHNALAWIYATLDNDKYLNAEKAIFHATKSCELTEWKNYGYIDTLAAAYARAGNYQKAIYWQEKVVAARKFQPEKVESSRMRLNLYRSGKAYVDK
ncbi:MAG: tetratricopeptide repeat protein [Gammaproteobacteria bacterium]|nr:tetratricopeptide repeat protein [Gammaproteobacteria bacterium]MDH5803299.1 tetratricopeptide repeat protein [Gammaproteobacteria bacterium]